MIAAKLIYLFETPENSEFIFLLGFEDGVFLRFKMKFFNKKVKDSMKNKSKIQDLCIIEVRNNFKIVKFLKFFRKSSYLTQKLRLSPTLKSISSK